MKRLHKILSAVAVLALVIACAVVSINADAAVTPSSETYTTASICPHCNQAVTWTPLTAITNNTFITASGHYVVEAGTTLTYANTTSIGASASDVAILVIGNIDLTDAGQLRFGNNGTTDTWLIGGGGRIQGGNTPGTATNPSLLGVYNSGTLNIIGNITVQGNETAAVTANRGGVINVYGNGKVNLYGGTVKGYQLDSANEKSYSGVLLRGGGTMYMYGGIIQGGSSKYGPAVYISNGSFTMEGGTVNGGTSTGSGSAIYLSEGSVNIAGSAQLNGGTCGASGGIFYQAGGTVTVGGNALLTGSDANYGCVAYVSDGSFTVSGNARLIGADANNYGGTIYCNDELNITGGTIQGGTAVTGGGAISTNGGTINISGGTIQGGEAANGGTIYLRSGSITMTDGTIQGGIARNTGVDSKDGHGGCMYLAAGTATFRGGTISGGQTVRVKNASNKYNGGDGGTFYVAATVNLDGATVNGGTCYRGGVFFVTGSNGKVNMTAGAINSGVASNQGDLAAVYSSGTFNMTGGVAHNSEVGEGSGIRVQSGKVYLHGDALVEAAAGGRNGFDMISAGSTSAVLVLAGNARVGDLEGNQTNVHNITFQSYTSSGTTYYPKLQIANDWTGYASITDNFGSTATGEYIMAVTSGDTTNYYARCGTWDAATATFTPTGNYDAGKLIHGGADEGDLPVFGEGGNLMLPRAKAVVNDTASWYRVSDQAVDAAYEGGYTVLYKDDETPITIPAGKTAYVDFNGFSATVTGEGTLKGSDSSALATGTGTSEITVEGVTVETLVANPATGENFVAITEDSTATFHAVTANIVSATIRPETVSLYYTASFVCDDIIKPYLNNYGVAVSLKNMPGEDYAQDSDTLYTGIDPASFESGVQNSVLITGIMKEALEAAANKSRGEMPIYANAYMKLTIGGEEITVMANETAAHSLQTLLTEVNTYWDTFPESAHDSLATQLYEPYMRDFEDGDWGIYNLRIHANGGYTPEEEAILEQRRQTVMDYMRESISLLWRSDKTFTYSLGNTERDQGKSFTIVEGRLYKGLPYVYAAGTRDSFLEYAGEPDEYGIYTITGVEATALNYESYGGRVGNDCSGAVTNAWSQVSTSVSASTSSGCSPYFGVVPVGNYLFNAPINPSNNRVLDTKVVVETNGEQVMYEAYAMLKPADAAYHQEYPSTKGNHIRMVKEVNVVRNTDGTINGASSYIIMLEQTRNLTSNNTTTTHPETGETIYVIGGIDRKYTFNSLFNDHYIPVTIKELRDPTALEETWVADSLEEEATIDNLFTGNISSNRYTDSVKITIYNEEGEVVQQSISRKSRSYSKLFRMSQFVNEKPGSFKGLLDLDALEAGNYRCTVTLKLTIDDDYVHTVRDFTFSK